MKNGESMKSITEKALDNLMGMVDSDRLMTRFDDLDRLGGFGKDELIMLGARPAMGKTGFAISILDNICFNGGKRRLYFSREGLSSEKAVERIITTVAEGYRDSAFDRADLSEEKTESWKKRLILYRDQSL